RLTPQEVKFAETIHASGTELLALINDILDLSKIESGVMAVELEHTLFTDLQDYAERSFRHVAEGKGLHFNVEIDPNLPRTIYSDPKRLQQVLKNLLSNAVKFTDQGEVALRIEPVSSGWTASHETLDRGEGVVAFSV